MANKLNMSQSAYAKIENGITKLDIDRLVDITKILKIDIQDLLNIENVKIIITIISINSPGC